MPSTINASTASGGGIISAADSSGVLELQTAGTTAIAISSAQAVTIQGLTVGRGAGAIATNTAVGADALSANTTGSRNSAFGINALKTNTTGASNNSFGINALFSNTSGSNNIAIGDSALNANTTGVENTAIGDSALRASTTGNNNVAVGINALRANTTAGSNTAVGTNALIANTTGTQNSAFGQQALNSNTTANYNTAIGFQSLYTNTTTGYNVAIGYRAAYTSAASIGGNTVIGPDAGFALTTGSHNTFIGAQGTVSGGSGGLITTGSYNTILGGYNGNQDGLDTRTGNGWVVISDGAGNRVLTGYRNGTLGLDGVVPVAGTGITFPATQNASSNANTLDDYEEGTWTPSLGGNTTYTERFGQYVKVGRLVTVWFDLTVNSIGTGSTSIIAGLPFTASGVATGMAGSVSYWAATATAFTAIYLRIDINSSQILTASTSGNQTTCTNLPTIFGNNARLIASASYYANA